MLPFDFCWVWIVARLAVEQSQLTRILLWQIVCKQSRMRLHHHQKLKRVAASTIITDWSASAILCTAKSPLSSSFMQAFRFCSFSSVIWRCHFLFSWTSSAVAGTRNCRSRMNSSLDRLVYVNGLDRSSTESKDTENKNILSSHAREMSYCEYGWIGWLDRLLAMSSENISLTTSFLVVQCL